MFESLLVVVALLNFSGDDFQRSNSKIQRRPAVKEVGDIGGYYICRGEEASGKRYSGITTIVRRGDVYLVTWAMGTGPSFGGIGIRKGDMLAVSWAISTEKGIMKGVNFYKIDPGPTGPNLSGEWASMPGNGQMQSEILRFLSPLLAEDD